MKSTLSIAVIGSLYVGFGINPEKEILKRVTLTEAIMAEMSISDWSEKFLELYVSMSQSTLFCGTERKRYERSRQTSYAYIYICSGLASCLFSL